MPENSFRFYFVGQFSPGDGSSYRLDTLVDFFRDANKGPIIILKPYRDCCRGAAARILPITSPFAKVAKSLGGIP